MKYLKSIALMLVTALLFASCGNQSDKKTITFAYVNWAEGIAMTNLAKILFEEQGYKVKMKNADIAPIFAALAKKDADVFLDSWLPITHADYFKQYGDAIEEIDTLFNDATIGLVVPSYVTINSIEELNSVKDQFEGEIVGIDAGAGVMKVTEQAIKDYNLDFKLLSSTGPMMTAALKKAIDENKWVVVTGWKPHWKFSRFDLKILEDPKNVYGEAEVIKSICRKGFKEEDPFATELIGNMKFTNEQISSLMDALEDAPTEVMGVKSWMKDNQELVDSWIPKKLEE
ncbi:Substrate-binding region of ABC-type glycine betaine transport system [Bacteroides coprosuis DSM 18011]|uniref:Substrate-binding region of ABC-type glycine betaine transport system n=1 Tax=Bacteroides coprosuis DSM 18011 TaxID=679937 RepID=F3ZNR9_9BACE|nr:glycine betaine ABC transporter substrate-binding protein [Bacteroides coprosuis]EGJ70258.1 Substrate-binding region of ABC-type glycine betaine transport system [Bacteroides coprosuis DSM 18011]